MANCSNFSTEDLRVIGLTGAVTSSISFISCLFVIALLVLFKKYTFTTQRLVLYLTLSVLFDSITHIMQGAGFNVLSGSKFCLAIAFLRQYFAWCILLSIICILMELSLRAVCRRESGHVEWFYIPFIFLVPLTISWIPFIKESYGDVDGSCNFLTISPGTCKRDSFALILDIALWWVPLYCTFIVGCLAYLGILCYLNVAKNRYTPLVELDREFIYNRTISDIGYFKWYPLIYILINIIPIIDALISYVKPQDSELALKILTTIITGLQGGFVAMAAALDPQTRRRLTWRSFRMAFKENVLCREMSEEYPIIESSMSDSLNMSQK